MLKIADLYSAPLGVVEKLVEDPDHGGQKTVTSCIEAMVALELEKDGILGVTISRGPSKTDLQDGWQRKWDVKAQPIVPDIPFNMANVIHSIQKKFKEFPNHDIGILLCVSFLDAPIYKQLQATLASALTVNQLFRVRQVTIEAFPEL